MPLQLQLKEQVKSLGNCNHNKVCMVIFFKKIIPMKKLFFFFLLPTPFQEKIVSLVNLQPLPS